MVNTTESRKGKVTVAFCPLARLKEGTSVGLAYFPARLVEFKLQIYHLI